VLGKPLADFNVITQLAASMKAPPPEAGKASVSGLLYSKGIGEVIPGTFYYLTLAEKLGDRYVPPSVYTNPDPAKGDVASQTDMAGRFVLTDVEPGIYYLAVFAPYDWLLAYPNNEAIAARQPQQIELKPDQALDLGLLYVPWP
jgi:hypothetical protein